MAGRKGINFLQEFKNNAIYELLGQYRYSCPCASHVEIREGRYSLTHLQLSTR
jgi:hypothetical protein